MTGIGGPRDGLQLQALEKVCHAVVGRTQRAPRETWCCDHSEGVLPVTQGHTEYLDASACHADPPWWH